ncbi:hypothetical protein QQX98_007454 [Neonectria punicea]|uniref:PD-(D/E)XK nuclease-like domain-containing protein n=1 Tax=Neonectria punicea TaxID=979145 RepID=A0ABR1GYF0_9HYPO
MSHDLKQVALALLKRGCQDIQRQLEIGKALEPGSVLRYTGTSNTTGSATETEPVIFLAAPYLHLKEGKRHPATSEDFVSMTLLQSLYGYDLGDGLEGSIVTEKLDASLAGKKIYVPQLWCLLIGSGILVTFGECSLADIQADCISTEERASGIYGDSLVINVFDVDGEEFKVSIDRNFSLWKLTAHLSHVVKKKYSSHTAFEILGIDKQPLDPEGWISLVANASEELSLFIHPKGQKVADPTSRPQSQSHAPGSPHLQPHPQLYGRGQYGMVPYDQSCYHNPYPGMQNPFTPTTHLAQSKSPAPPPPTEAPVPALKSQSLKSDVDGRSGFDSEGPVDVFKYLVSSGETPLTKKQEIAYLVLGNEHAHSSRPTSYIGRDVESKEPRVRSSSTPAHDTRAPWIPELFDLNPDAGGPLPGQPEDGLDDASLSASSVSEGDDSLSPGVTPSSTSANRKTKRVRMAADDEPESGSRPGSEGAPSTKTNASVSKLPFLMWNNSADEEEMDGSTAIPRVGKLLTNVGTSLSARKVTGKLYSRSYGCSLEELQQRHPEWSDTAAPSTVGQDHRNDDQISMVSLAGGGDAQQTQSPANSSRESKGKQFAVKTSEGVNMGRLFKISKELLELFVPLDLQLLYPLIETYWGSLDRMSRASLLNVNTTQEHSNQVKYVAEHYEPNMTQSWTIREFHTEDNNWGRHGAPQIPYRDCSACTRGQTYDSASSLLDHIHQVHNRCPGSEKYRSPFDDPCYVWAEATHRHYHNPRYLQTALLVVKFRGELEDILRKAKQLQLVAAGVESPPDATKTPPLSEPILRVFEDIVMGHVLMAKCLSLASRWMNGGSDSVDRAPDSLKPKVSELIELSAQCLPQASLSLDRAWTEVMSPGTTLSKGAGIHLEPIGGGFLVAVILGNLQKQVLNSDLRPGALLERYQKYTAKLQFQARQNPKRRLFLDIQALQEELGAFQNVAKSQRDLLAEYLKLSSPDLSQNATPTMRNLFIIEERYIERLQQERRARDARLDILQERLSTLKNRVKQSIEILEEGHGKAIRVFTLVTLFFLPLSFLSSLFGMNTVDIRDMENGQTLYWSIALPVTFGILVLAFLYGYKWDSIVGRFQSHLEHYHSTRKSPPVNKEDQNATQGDTQTITNPAMLDSHIQGWIDRVVVSSLSPQARPRASQSRKRPQPDLDFDFTTGLSSPPRSLDDSSPDLDATPRAGTWSKRRRVDIPSASTPNLRHPSEDGRVATPTRQRSPVKNIADLMLAGKSIRFTTAKTRGGIPDDVADLIEHIKAVSNGDKIIPQSMAEDVKKSLDLLDPAIEDRNTITWDVADEFRMLQKIVSTTSECDAEYLSEPSWNCTVHHPLLELALAPFQGSVSHWDVTKAPITKAYHPRHSSGNDLQGKMVDFCVTLDSEAIRYRVIERLKTSNHKSIAHTEYPALRFRPIAVSIETKTPDGSTETARTQLAMWASAHIARLRELAATADDAAGLGITLPLISIRGAEWDLLFAVDHATSVEIVRNGPIGDTTSIVSCYKLLAMIRWLTVWVTGTFCEWMVKNALVVS